MFRRENLDSEPMGNFPSFSFCPISSLTAHLDSLSSNLSFNFFHLLPLAVVLEVYYSCLYLFFAVIFNQVAHIHLQTSPAVEY